MNSSLKDGAIEKRLIDRGRWLARLRWIAVLGVFATFFIASRLFRVFLEPRPLCIIAICLAIYNGFSAGLLPVLRERRMYGAVKILANAQIFLDLTCLVLLIHFSGGVENPFYFIFHIIIAGILLPRRETFILATYAVLIFPGMVLGEQQRFLQHHVLLADLATSLRESATYVMGVSFVFVSTLYIAAYLTTSIPAGCMSGIAICSNSMSSWPKKTGSRASMSFA